MAFAAFLLLFPLSPATAQPEASAAAPEPAAAVPEATAAGETAPAGLESTADPFASGVFLQARALRGLSARVAATVLTAEPGGEIALAVLPLPVASGPRGEPEVRLFVEIDGATFLSHNQAELARVEVYAYALAAGKVAGYTAEAFAVPVAERGEAIWQSGLKVYGRLELPAGRYTLRILVRNDASGARGLVELPLEVPETVPASLLIPDPGRRDAWLPVRGWRLPEHPFLAAGEAVRPAAHPVLLTGRPGELFLALGGAAALPAAVRLELLAGSAEEGPAGEVDLTPGAAEPATAAGGPLLVPFRFRVPELPAGDYRARLVTAPGGAVLTPEVPVIVAPAGPQQRDLLWTDLRWRMGGGEAALADLGVPQPGGLEGAAGGGRKARRRLRKLGQAYRDALTGLTADLAAPGPRSALLDFETTALAASGPRQPASLQAAELEVARELAARDPASVLPLIALHHDLYLTYRGRRLYALAAHSVGQLELLAELYAAEGGDAATAARMLALLGGYQQEALLVASSRRLFVRALAHDPASAAALLGLAASAEKYGEYGAAVDLLDRLVAAHPEAHEGWLRLAVNLRRTGGGPRARQILARLAGSPAPRWVRALAHEELARTHLESGQIEAAREVLEQALRRLPGEGGPRLLLAHVYDRQGRYRQALALLEEQRPGGGDGDGSPRRRYDAWPRDELAEARRELTERAVQGLPALGRSLDGAGG